MVEEQAKKIEEKKIEKKAKPSEAKKVETKTETHNHEGHDHAHDHAHDHKHEEVKKEVGKDFASSDKKKDSEPAKSFSKPAVEKKSSKGLEVKKDIVELEREYVIPLRKDILKVAYYRRAKKAIWSIRKFLAKHMRVEDRDTRKIKIDKYLNNEMWFRGIANPWHKIKVKAKKIGGIVYVELADIPEKVKFDMARDQKRKLADDKLNVKTPKHVKENDHIEEGEKTKTEEQKTDVKEKEKSSVEAGLARQEASAKKTKHTETGVHEKKVTPRRQVLKK